MIRINRHWLALAVGAGFAMTPSPALAECAQWDMNGEWRFVQSNMSFNFSPVFKLQQTDNQVQGIATFILTKYVEGELIGETSTAYGVRVDGAVHGGIKGDSVELVVFWHGQNSIGVYTGEIGSHRLIEGSTYDQRHPEVTATWISDRPIGCRTGAGPAGERISTTSSALTTAPPPPEPTVRAQRRIPRDPDAPPRPALSICEAAKLARDRNSPATPGLEAQCRAEQAAVDAIDLDSPQPIAGGAQAEEGGQTEFQEVLSARQRAQDLAAQVSKKTTETAKAVSAGQTPGPEPLKAQGRVNTGAPAKKLPICDAAKLARDRNSPATPGLTKQCLDGGGTIPQ
jgi:hypothetical protein